MQLIQGCAQLKSGLVSCDDAALMTLSIQAAVEQMCQLPAVKAGNTCL